ncbi:MAG: hypothetical protein AAGE52_21940 [Myxococcota bacterium]
MRERLRELSPTLLAGAALAWMVPVILGIAIGADVPGRHSSSFPWVLGAVVVTACLSSLSWPAKTRRPWVGALPLGFFLLVGAALVPFFGDVPTLLRDGFGDALSSGALTLQALALLVASFAIARPGPGLERQVAVSLGAFWLLGVWSASGSLRSWGGIAWFDSLEVAACGPAAHGMVRALTGIVAGATGCVALARARRYRGALAALSACLFLRGVADALSALAAKDVCQGVAIVTHLETLALATTAVDVLAGAVAVIAFTRAGAPRVVLPLILLSTSPALDVSNDLVSAEPPAWEEVDGFRPLLWPEGDGVVVDAFRDDASAVLDGEELRVFTNGSHTILEPYAFRVQPAPVRGTLPILVDERSTLAELRRAARMLGRGTPMIVLWKTSHLGDASAARSRWDFVERASHALRGRVVRTIRPDGCRRGELCMVGGREVEVVRLPDSTLVADWLRGTNSSGKSYALAVPQYGEAGPLDPPRSRPRFSSHVVPMPTTFGALIGFAFIVLAGPFRIVVALRRADRIRRRAVPCPGPHESLPRFPPWIRHGTRVQTRVRDPYREEPSIVLVADMTTALRQLGHPAQAAMVRGTEVLTRAVFALVVFGILGAVIPLLLP